jgi:hypothetical protein
VRGAVVGSAASARGTVVAHGGGVRIRTLAWVIALSPSCSTHDEGPPGGPSDACGGYDGLGTVDIGGSGFTPVNAWAFYGSSPVALGATDAVGLQVVMSTDASLSCATVAEFASGQVQAYVMSAVPPGSDAVTPGNYDVQGSASQAEPLSADIDFLFCSGGQYNSCGFLQPQAGSMTLDTVDSPVTGAFSVTFQGEDAASGNFCAPICNPAS